MIKNASIRVGIKIKPLSSGNGVIAVDSEKKEIRVKLPGDQTQSVQVDMIHDANTSTDLIYNTCNIKTLIGKFIEGYNITILTYGQTGSGKTFAFEGDSKTQGIIFQSIADIYANKTSNNAILKCSFVQLYNEKLSDMLNPELVMQRGLKMRWQVDRQFIIEDLTEKQCLTSQDMVKEWTVGNKNRIVASNKIHDYSSRSHSIFIVTMEDQDEEKNYRIRQAYFVDLAGSERVFSPVGRLSKEAIQINKSLFFLRKVILSLQEMNSQKKEQYIPYRDSKLTSILKKAFGGNCITYLIACLNPHEDYLQQTLSTLQYAVSAGKIHNQVNINIDIKSREIRELKEDKRKIQKQLQMALLQIQMFKSIEREEELKRATNHQYANRIIQCIGTVRQLLKSNKELRAELEREKFQRRKLALDLQETEKRLKQSKRLSDLTPIKQIDEQNVHSKATMIDTKSKFLPSPRRKDTKLKTQITASPQLLISDRPLYSHSVDIFRKKQRGKTVVHRKRYQFYQGNSTK